MAAVEKDTVGLNMILLDIDRDCQKIVVTDRYSCHHVGCRRYFIQRFNWHFGGLVFFLVTTPDGLWEEGMVRRAENPVALPDGGVWFGWHW
jgi:hypothetical protein